MNRRNHREHYLRDILVLLASITLAIVLKNSGALTWLLERAEQVRYLGSFVAGAFFTSFFTVIPAVAAIAQLSQSGIPIAQLALAGAAGAMVADSIIYFLLREAVAEPLLMLVQAGSSERLKRFVRRGKHRFTGTLIGAIIIASPFPDELGLLLMGLSKARWYTMAIIAYVLNAGGIAIVALAARAL